MRRTESSVECERQASGLSIGWFHQGDPSHSGNRRKGTGPEADRPGRPSFTGAPTTSKTDRSPTGDRHILPPVRQLVKADIAFYVADLWDLPTEDLASDLTNIKTNRHHWSIFLR